MGGNKYDVYRFQGLRVTAESRQCENDDFCIIIPNMTAHDDLLAHLDPNLDDGMDSDWYTRRTVRCVPRADMFSNMIKQSRESGVLSET